MFLGEAYKQIESISNRTVEVFKTNMSDVDTASQILEGLKQRFPSLNINFDLEYCDKILRVAGYNVDPGHIIEYMQVRGFICQELDD